MQALEDPTLSAQQSDSAVPHVMHVATYRIVTKTSAKVVRNLTYIKSPAPPAHSFTPLIPLST